MKNLTITYGEITLFCGDVDELVWSDSEHQVAVTGRRKKAAAGGAISGIGELLARAGKAKAQAVADAHKEADTDG